MANTVSWAAWERDASCGPFLADCPIRRQRHQGASGAVDPGFLSAIVCAPSLVMRRGNRDLRHPGLVSCRADVDDFQDHPVWGQQGYRTEDVARAGPAGFRDRITWVVYAVDRAVSGVVGQFALLDRSDQSAVVPVPANTAAPGQW